MKSSFRLGSSLHSDKYRPDIDGIRAIAVSSVVIGHGFPRWLPGGFIGVDIFFVISGYLISSILIRDLNRGSFSLVHFYNRRIKRIFPALVVVLLFVIAAGWFCLFASEFIALGQHISASTLFSENFLLWREAGYFDVSSNSKVTLHLWSLAIEEQFYIFWPLLMFVVHRGRMNFASLFLIFATLSFLINLYDIHTDPTAAYYSPLGRSWELMVGSCLAYIQVHRPALLARFSKVESLSGLILIFLGLLFIKPDTGFPGFWALLPTMGCFLLIAAGENGWVNRHLLAKAPMVWCGLISYPLYLWHWPMLSFGRIIFGHLSPLRVMMLIVLAVAASAFTFFFIERPFRKPGAGPRRTLIPLGGMIAVLGCGLLFMTQTISPRLVKIDAPSKTEWDFLKSRTDHFDRNPANFYPISADRHDLVLFIGDSHIAQYAERLDKIIETHPEFPGVIMAIGGGCIPIEGAMTEDIKRSKCWSMREEAYRMSLENRFHTIVIGGAWNWYFLTGDYEIDADGKAQPLISQEGRKTALDRLAKRIEMLVRAGKKVILVLDNPHSEKFIVDSKQIRLGFSARNFRENQTAPVNASQRALQTQIGRLAERSGATVIDPFSAVCMGNVCRVTDSTGRPLYKDAGHFNPDWTIEHAHFIDAALERFPIMLDRSHTS